MTPSHSPLPWTVRQEGAIFDADGVPVISDDGALYPEDRDLIVTAVNNYEKMRKFSRASLQHVTDALDRCKAEIDEALTFPSSPPPPSGSKPTVEELQAILDSDLTGEERVFSKPEKVFDNIADALADADARESAISPPSGLREALAVLREMEAISFGCSSKTAQQINEYFNRRATDALILLASPSEPVPAKAGDGWVKVERIYLASRYSRFKEMQQYRDELEADGFNVTSRWINGGHQIDDAGLSVQAKEAERIRFAQEDRDDLLAADCIISFTEPPRSTNSRGGRHVEHGIALGLGKRTIVVGHRENVFHCLPEVEFYGSWVEARANLDRRPSAEQGG